MSGPGRYYLSPGSPSPGGWYPPYGVDVGLPVGPYTLVGTGVGQGAGYHVQREFTNALVIGRFYGWWLPEPDWHTPMNFPLPAGVWRRVLDNGTLASPQTSVDLRLAEAAIFIKA
jgi:hypothetical protein